MSDTAEAKKLIRRYSIARIPFIAINTIERGRTLDILKEISEELSLPFYVHTLSKGVYDIATDKVLDEDKSVYGAIDFITEQMKRKQYLTIVLTEVPDLSTDNADSKQILALVNLANESGGVVIVLTNNPVWNQLQRQGLVLKIDLPNEDEMYGIIKEYIDDYRNEIPIEWDNSDIREAASMLAGVTRIEAENVIAALIANKCVRKADLDEIRYAKDRLFSDISGLEKIEVDDNVKDVGGLEGLRKWLDEKKELLTPEKRDELRAKGLQPPRGILLVGVPGCGKSLSAKSISANWKLPLYRLDFATVQGSYVGQSEQQLKDALTTAENVAPCILWIDEIEKGLSGAGSSNDGGVSTRMVGQFLFSGCRSARSRCLLWRRPMTSPCFRQSSCGADVLTNCSLWTFLRRTRGGISWRCICASTSAWNLRGRLRTRSWRSATALRARIWNPRSGIWLTV